MVPFEAESQARQHSGAVLEATLRLHTLRPSSFGHNLHMPLVRIEVFKGRSASERRSLLDGVHAALVEAFGIPEDDRTQRLVEYDLENLEVEPGRSEKYVLVEITAFPGRSTAAKRSLCQAIVRRLGAEEVPADDISIVLNEPPLENWGIRGGRSAHEVDLGFRLDR